MYLFLPFSFKIKSAPQPPLHSKMYLFLRCGDPGLVKEEGTLHSKMYLFLQKTRSLLISGVTSLHSKMYLFLPSSVGLSSSPQKLYIPKCIYFYVTIQVIIIPFQAFTFQNVSISTNLRSLNVCNRIRFTFQNVSISTDSGYLKSCSSVSLHSKMYLFLPYEQVSDYLKEQLYIPKCIYFYLQMVSLNLKNINFTFQNVSISTNLFPSFKACRSVFTFQNVSISTCSRQRLPAVL